MCSTIITICIVFSEAFEHKLYKSWPFTCYIYPYIFQGAFTKNKDVLLDINTVYLSAQ